MGDDPILWREMTTMRESLLGRMIGLLFVLGIYGTLGYYTFFFAARVHGALAPRLQLGLGECCSARVELGTRIFMQATGPARGGSARNRVQLVFALPSPARWCFSSRCWRWAGRPAIVTERARGTWDSLIATSLSARDILRSKMLATAWPSWTAATLLVLWTLGLAAGAIHPLGFIAAMLVTASSCWLYLNFALLASVKASDVARAMNPSIGLFFLADALVAFIYLCRADRIGVLGAAAPPFVALLALASYRDVHIGLTDSAVPILQWININTGEGPLTIVSLCLIAIIAQALGGLCFWRYSVAHFDRLVGRPWRPASVANKRWRAQPTRSAARSVAAHSGPPDRARGGSGNASRTCDSAVSGTIVP